MFRGRNQVVLEQTTQKATMKERDTHLQLSLLTCAALYCATTRISCAVAKAIVWEVNGLKVARFMLRSNYNVE